MFIKRAKSRPSLRARDSEGEPAPSPLGRSVVTATPDDNEDEDTGGSGSVLERKKAQKKDKRVSGIKSGGTRLSFGGEGDESEGFKPKKSLLSQNIKLPPATTSDYSPSASGSSYSREYLSELKASTPTRAPRAAVEDTDEDEDDGTGLSRAARDKYASSFVEDTTAGIPDAAAVASARMKRQAKVESAKHGGEMEEDYIALGGGRLIVHDGSKDGPHPESRLMREEDEDDEGDEDLAGYTEAGERLYIGKKATKAAARRERGEIGELIADREADDESDEETREWEMAQARRAGGRFDDGPDKAVKRSYIPTPIPSARPIPTISSAQSRISQALAELRLTKSENEHNLEIAATELSSLEEQERDLRKEVERVEGKREWVEEFRGWVEMLGGFLEEKFPKLEAIESDSVLHLKERADMVEKRRNADDSDDLALFLGVPPASADEVEEVDEMGRSRRDFEAGPSSGVRKARRSERETRRQRRQARRPANSADDDGYSTDSTLAEADAEDYSHAQDQLGRRVIGLLEDVKAEDFRDPEKGLAVRFGEWRRRYEDEYVGAFGGLSMVQAWAFWARGEMIGWEPMRSSSSIESFSWFNALHAYSHPRLHAAPPEDEDMDDDEPPLGPDGDLNAQMVNDAVVPLLIKAFENGAYDPYSAGQTRRAIDLLEVVEGLAGKDSRKFTSLLKSALISINNHINSLSSTIVSCSLPLSTPPPAFDPSSRSALERYVRRRLKLIRNLMLWRRMAPEEIRGMVGRLVREVVRPVLEKGWEGGGREMADKVLQASGGMLPPDLIASLQRGP